MLTQSLLDGRPGMMPRVRLRVPVLFLALLLPLGLLAGCSEDKAEPATGLFG
jgi:hypothetical protein